MDKKQFVEELINRCLLNNVLLLHQAIAQPDCINLKLKKQESNIYVDIFDHKLVLNVFRNKKQVYGDSFEMVDGENVLDKIISVLYIHV